MAKEQKLQTLSVALIGKVASNAREILLPRLNTPCRFFAFPNARENPRLLKALPGIDVAVGNYFTERMVRAAANLKLLQVPNAGIDSLPLATLAPETTVANVHFHGPAVAEYVIMMILALGRDLLGSDSLFRQGIWRGSWIEGELPREEVLGKTLGIVGFGHIGREVARRAQALGMKIMVTSAHPPARKPKGINSWKGPAALGDLLRCADYVVLACPLNNQTEGLLGPEQFRLMKPSAFLINVSRGPVVQEAAFYHALKSRRIAGAAIDVWYRYPKNKRPTRPSRFPFHQLENVIMTPHLSGWMRGTRDQRLQLVAENINRLASGKPLLNVVQGPKRHRRSMGHPSGAR